jgi:hypothetical protein
MARKKKTRRRKLSKQEKRRWLTRQRRRLLERLGPDLEDRPTNVKVGHILSIYPHTRNSDVELCKYYWKTFNPEIVDADNKISLDDLHHAELYTSIVRARAKIQNEFRLFPASREIQGIRRGREREQREIQLGERPSAPIISVVCDESGKTGTYAIVASIWCNDWKRYHEVVMKLFDWKNERNMRKEFHFNKLKKGDVANATEFFTQAYAEADAVCFKAVLIERAGFRGTNTDLFIRLHNQLCLRGIEYERDHNRIQLPREINVVKDSEDTQDKMYVAELRQRLSTDLPRAFGNEVRLAGVESTDSKAHPLTQVADLFAGSLNRVLNEDIAFEDQHHKDEVAVNILGVLGVDPEEPDAEIAQDLVMIHKL